jgi:hypothetical protein
VTGWLDRPLLDLETVDLAMVTTFGGPVLERMEVWAQEAAAEVEVEPPADRLAVPDPGAAP